MQYVNFLQKRGASKDALKSLALVLAPFTPHLSEDLWEILGNKRFISLQKWPLYDKDKIDERLEASEQLAIDTMFDISQVIKLAKIEAPRKITIIVSRRWKFQLFKLFKKEI